MLEYFLCLSIKLMTRPKESGWGSEQRDLVKDVSAHGREVGLDDL